MGLFVFSIHYLQMTVRKQVCNLLQASIVIKINSIDAIVYNLFFKKYIAVFKATITFVHRFVSKIKTVMEIQSSEQHANAIEQVVLWLKKEDYSVKSMLEIERVILAIEHYSGMPLPARSFIMSKVS